MPENETIVFEAKNEVGLVDDPKPAPDADEVLIETERTLISTGTELSLLTGAFQRDTFPFRPGYCNVGEVVEVGNEVDESLLGRTVATDTAHAQYTVSTPESCRLVPPEVDREDATFFKLAEFVMNGIRRGRLTWGETVAVFGLGLMGQLTARFAHIAGSETVVGLDIVPDRLALLPDHAGVVGVDSTADDWVERVTDSTGGHLADVVYEVTGNGDVLTMETDILRSQGRLVVLGSPRGETAFDFYSECHYPGFEIIGAHATTHPETATRASPWTETRHGELFFDYLSDGRIEVDSLVSHRMDYREAPGAFEMLLEDRTQAMGVVLEW